MSVILNANILFMYSIFSTLGVTYKIIRVRIYNDHRSPLYIRRVWCNRPHLTIQTVPLLTCKFEHYVNKIRYIIQLILTVCITLGEVHRYCLRFKLLTRLFVTIDRIFLYLKCNCIKNWFTKWVSYVYCMIFCSV